MTHHLTYSELRKVILSATRAVSLPGVQVLRPTELLERAPGLFGILLRS
jgi:hypothetical protein